MTQRMRETAIAPELPAAAKPVASKPVATPAGTRIGLNTTNSGMLAINATAVPARETPASNKRNIAACVANIEVKTLLNDGLLDFLLCFFLSTPIFH